MAVIKYIGGNCHWYDTAGINQLVCRSPPNSYRNKWKSSVQQAFDPWAAFFDNGLYKHNIMPFWCNCLVFGKHSGCCQLSSESGIYFFGFHRYTHFDLHLVSLCFIQHPQRRSEARKVWEVNETYHTCVFADNNTEHIYTLFVPVGWKQLLPPWSPVLSVRIDMFFGPYFYIFHDTVQQEEDPSWSFPANGFLRGAHYHHQHSGYPDIRYSLKLGRDYTGHFYNLSVHSEPASWNRLSDQSV